MNLAVPAVVCPGDVDHPPIVLGHGAANSARIWTFWQAAFADRGFSSWALGLRGHGESRATDLSETTMQDYAADVGTVVRQLTRAPVLIRWSMGGLAAMMAAARGGVAACVGFSPSPPAGARDNSAALRHGTFGAEEYRIVTCDPADQVAMPRLDLEERRIALASLGPEPRHARDDRKAGIVLRAMPCPMLIVTSAADAQLPLSAAMTRS